jgi:hypothetical protein
MRSKLFTLLMIFILFLIYTLSYLHWKNSVIQILTPSQYSGEKKKPDERAEIFYLSSNDSRTFSGLIFIPAIMADLCIHDLEIVEE